MDNQATDATSWARVWAGSWPTIIALGLFQLTFVLVSERGGSLGASLPLFAGFMVPMMSLVNLRSLLLKYDAATGYSAKPQSAISRAIFPIMVLAITGWMVMRYWYAP